MKYLEEIQNSIISLFVVLNSLCAFGQVDIISEKKTVFIEITSFTDASVSFSWYNYDTILSTYIYRKELAGSNWTLLNVVNSTTYTDYTITTNKEYEYQFKAIRQTSPTEVYGYIAFGIGISKKTDRGNLLILLDDRFTNSLSNELRTLQMDMISDGYRPILVARSASLSPNKIKYVVDSINSISSVNGVLIIGHIAVPYSGLIYPDGHYDHRGAWPTDLYYVSDTATWKDKYYNHTNTSRPQNSNMSYDGKFDNNAISASCFATISRIDFFDMPKLQNSELDLLKNYFTELSKYKRGINTPEKKGVIENNFLNFSEGFAYNGYMNFSSLLKSSNLETQDVITTLSNNFYQWSYACGGGTDTSASGVGSISTFDKTDYKGVFSMLFGSYFGDWNTTNNLLRAYIANGKMLTTCWAGRPNWFFHHMGLNNPIGLSAYRTVHNSLTNNTEYKLPGYYSNTIHIALLGDFTLRNSYRSLVQNFTATYVSSSKQVNLSWDAYSEAYVASYDIYTANLALGPYTLLKEVSGTTTSYTDTVNEDSVFYFVQAVFLDSTNSGSYYNNTLGSFISINTSSSNSTSITLPVKLMHFTAKQQNRNGMLQWSSAQELNFSHYEILKSVEGKNWNVIGKQNGTNLNEVANYQFIDFDLQHGTNFYQLKMVDYDGSSEYSDIADITFTSNDYVLYPNPTNNGTVFINLSNNYKNLDIKDLTITDLSGKKIDFTFDETTNAVNIQERSGVYIFTLYRKQKKITLTN